MSTSSLLKTFKKYFQVNNFWLERFFGVSHATFQRYLSGENEAKFDEVYKWLKSLSLELINDKLFFRNGKFISQQSIDQMSKSRISSKFDSVLDAIEWANEGKAEEEKEGHKIFFLKPGEKWNTPT
jgi:hypothetical protein